MSALTADYFDVVLVNADTGYKVYASEITVTPSETSNVITITVGNTLTEHGNYYAIITIKNKDADNKIMVGTVNVTGTVISDVFEAQTTV